MSGEPRGPWILRSSRQAYANPWIRVREDQVTRPDGQPGLYGVVEFQNLATSIVPLFADGSTILVGQYRYPLGVETWETPQGGVPKGEDPLDGARRELAEETGLAAGRCTFLGTAYTSNCVTDEVGYCYLAEDLTEGEAHPEGTEVLTLRRLPFAQAVAMALRGEIADAMSVVSLLRADAYLRSDRRLAFC